MADRVQELEAEVERLRRACLIQAAVLSRIDYLCGEPNEMETSSYDLHCIEELVLAAVQRKIDNLQGQIDSCEEALKQAVREKKRGG